MSSSEMPATIAKYVNQGKIDRDGNLLTLSFQGEWNDSDARDICIYLCILDAMASKISKNDSRMDKYKTVFPIIFKKASPPNDIILLDVDKVNEWLIGEREYCAVFCLVETAKKWTLYLMGYVDQHSGLIINGPINQYSKVLAGIIKEDIVLCENQVMLKTSDLVRVIEEKKKEAPVDPVNVVDRMESPFFILYSLDELFVQFSPLVLNETMSQGGINDVIIKRLQLYKLLLIHNRNKTKSDTLYELVRLHSQSFVIGSIDLQRYAFIMLCTIAIYNVSFYSFFRECEELLVKIICDSHQGRHNCEIVHSESEIIPCEVLNHVTLLEKACETLSKFKAVIEQHKQMATAKMWILKQIKDNFGEVDKIHEHYVLGNKDLGYV